MEHIVTIIINGQKFPMYLEMSYAEVIDLVKTLYGGALDCSMRDFVITITPADSGGHENA